MSIKIHHGPPGSYKTAGAIGDDFLREAKAGRVIVTNCRGVSRERVLEEFPDLPETFDVINVDDKTEDGRERWSKWFHWVPKGAFLFIDEVQDIWPKRWRDGDIKALDYPGGVRQAGIDDRPFCWEQAFDKHRHWNWDMVLTSPSYKKIRDDVKGASEMAYKHKNLAVVGIRGRYIEAAHLSDDDGGSASHFLTVNQKKVPPYVFKIYDSTATGAVTDTKAGFSLFGNPRVAILLGIIVLVGGLVLSRPVPKVLSGIGQAPVPASSSGSKTIVPGTSASAALDRPALPSVDFSQDLRIEPFVDGDPYIVMSYKVGTRWKYAVRHKGSDFTTTDLLDMGYTVEMRGACSVVVIRDNFRRVVTCALPEQPVAPRNEAQRSDVVPPGQVPLTVSQNQSGTLG